MSAPQIQESDGTVNAAAAEPSPKGRDRRAACLGCGGIHGGVQSEINCLRTAIADCRRREELYRGQGMCTGVMCRNKAMLCRECARLT